MGIIKKLWKAMDDTPEEKALIKSQILATQIANQQREMMTCKNCKKIFSEGYPYQRYLFGKVKNYVCKDCAKKLKLI